MICEVVHTNFPQYNLVWLVLYPKLLHFSVYRVKCYAKNMNLKHGLWLNIHCDVLITNLILQTIFLWNWREDSTVRKLKIRAIMTWMIDCYSSWEVPEDFPTKLLGVMLLVDWQDFYVKFDKRGHDCTKLHFSQD